ncbi:MAG: deoxyribonuclease IV [Acidobacteriota bacterium]
MNLRVGVHNSIAGGLPQAIRLAVELGSNTLQIFSRNPRGWAARPLSTEEIENFRSARNEAGLSPLVVHACYLINLAAQDEAMLKKSIAAFRDELTRAVAIGADYLVVHPGCAKGVDIEVGIKTCCRALKRAARSLNLGKLMILIENTAGQGSAIGCCFEQVREILDHGNGLPLGVCLDTAHCYASGYDISAPDKFANILQELTTTIGIDNIKVIHCNDSKVPLASRVDRHWHIGEGHIGKQGFELLLREPRLNHLPLILETPIDKAHDDRWNLAQIRAIAASLVI